MVIFALIIAADLLEEVLPTARHGVFVTALNLKLRFLQFRVIVFVVSSFFFDCILMIGICPNDTYGFNGRCVPLSSCPSGTELVANATASSDRVCLPCPGYFRETLVCFKLKPAQAMTMRMDRRLACHVKLEPTPEACLWALAVRSFAGSAQLTVTPIRARRVSHVME